MKKTEPEITFIEWNEASETLGPNAYFLSLLRTNQLPIIRSEFGQFSQRLFSFDPLHLLGVTAFYCHIWASDASVKKKDNYVLELADGEAMQALLLTKAFMEKPVATPDDLPSLWEELRAQYFAAITGEDSPQLSPVQSSLANQLRLHSAYYRNPYGQEFVREMMVAVTSDIDQRWKNCLVRSSAFFQFLFAVVDEIVRRFGEVHARMHCLLTADSKDLLRLIEEFFPPLAENEVDSINTMDSQTLKWWGYQQIENRALELFAFTPDELHQLAPSGYDPFPYLQRCCYSFGDLANQDFRDLANGNPIWSRPFMQAFGRYFLFWPFTILSFPFHLLLSALGADLPDAKKRVEDVRGTYVEKRCEKLIRSHLPSAKVFRSLYWEDGDQKRYETDVIALAGKRLIVFEAKGALLPDRIRSGNFVKAKSFLKDTYGIAATQASRFIKAVMSAEPTKPIELKDGRGNSVLKLDGSSVTEIMAFPITIEQLGTLANARRMFLEAGILKEDIFPAPPIMLSELKQVLEMLPNEVYRIHYLIRRHQLHSLIDIVGDEMDIFAIYVMFGFARAFAEENTRVVALGASFHVKAHFQNGHLIFPDSSSVSNTRYFEKVFNYVLERKPSDYWELGIAILDLSPDIQAKFERAMKDLRTLAKQGNRDRMDICSVVVQHGPVSLVLCGAVYGDIDRNERNDTLQYALMKTIVQSKVKTGFLIGRQLGYWEYPYSVAIYLRHRLPEDAYNKDPDL
jgi:hypothetical protein